MAWRVARSINVLHAQLRPLAPNAPATLFGTIADDAHPSTSDHAPNDFPGWGNDIVTAGDFPKAGNLDPRRVLDNIRLSRDARVKYGISQGQMFSSYPAQGFAPWMWRPYAGSDGHFTHGHLSVVGDARADGMQLWQIGTPQGDDMDLETLRKELRRLAAFLVIGNLNELMDPKGPGAGWMAEPRAITNDKLATRLAAVAADVAAVKVAVLALASGGTSVDTGAVLAKMDELAAADLARDERHAAALADISAEVAKRDERIEQLQADLTRTRAAAEANLSPAERAELDGA